MIVAVGGPGDGRRYSVTPDMQVLRLFKDGPMRGNVVPAGIHLMAGTYVDYNLAEFGVQNESSCFLLKPMDAKLYDVIFLLTEEYGRFRPNEAERKEGRALL